MGSRTALLFGASGLVGGELLNILLNAPEYSKVTAFVRSPLNMENSKLIEKVTDFVDLSSHREDFAVDDVYCCLGTTIKKAGSREAFKRVDVDYPLEIAKLAKDMEAERFLVITSIGSKPDSVFFYSRMKGILERELEGLGLKSLYIFRPSLLLGKRKEERLGESIAAILSQAGSFFFTGPLKKYKPIDAKRVAWGMYVVARDGAEETYISNEELLGFKIIAGR